MNVLIKFDDLKIFQYLLKTFNSCDALLVEMFVKITNQFKISAMLSQSETLSLRQKLFLLSV